MTAGDPKTTLITGVSRGPRSAFGGRRARSRASYYRDRAHRHIRRPVQRGGLFVGAEALLLASQKSKRLQAEIRPWQHVSRATDYKNQA